MKKKTYKHSCNYAFYTDQTVCTATDKEPSILAIAHKIIDFPSCHRVQGSDSTAVTLQNTYIGLDFLLCSSSYICFAKISILTSAKTS